MSGNWDNLIDAANQTSSVMAQRQARLAEKHSRDACPFPWEADSDKCLECDLYDGCLTDYEFAFKHKV